MHYYQNPFISKVSPNSAVNSNDTYKQMLSEVHNLANSLVLDHVGKRRLPMKDHSPR